MESRLTWWSCCHWFRLGKNSWRHRSINTAFVFFGILLALPVSLNWKEIRYTSCVKLVWESVLGTAGNSEITYDRLLIVLGSGLVLTAMISILHIAFKVPFNLFANAESNPSSGKRAAAKVKNVKPETRLPIDDSGDGCRRYDERDGEPPRIIISAVSANVKSNNSHSSAVSANDKSNNSHPSAVSANDKSNNSHSSAVSANDKSNNSHPSAVSANDKSNNSHTTTSLTPFDFEHQSENEYTPLLTDSPTPYGVQSISTAITKQELADCLTDAASMGGEKTAHEILLQVQAEVSQTSGTIMDTETQTDELLPVLASIGTMTLGPDLVDVSVNTHQRVCKIVKNCGTSTSGPFMKKLRRAQRLLKEAKFKAKVERQNKVVKWRAVMDKYKEKLTKLFDNLEKKDRLLGHTALNRALSENEVKEICTAVRSSRDRLHTQCKLNSALREVIESKSETPGPACPTSGPATCR